MLTQFSDWLKFKISITGWLPSKGYAYKYITSPLMSWALNSPIEFKFPYVKGSNPQIDAQFAQIEEEACITVALERGFCQSPETGHIYFAPDFVAYLHGQQTLQ